MSFNQGETNLAKETKNRHMFPDTLIPFLSQESMQMIEISGMRACL